MVGEVALCGTIVAAPCVSFLRVYLRAPDHNIWSDPPDGLEVGLALDIYPLKVLLAVIVFRGSNLP